MATIMLKSSISTDIDYNKDGLQHGSLKLPYSRDDSAWGSILIPIIMIKKGQGKTALLTGGNHGDEYEGPVALTKLIKNIDVNMVNGRIIIVPFMNTPAFHAGMRTSPIDKGNLNRSFPGKPDGTITQKIADYFQRTLIPMADIVVDIHSGGRTLDFLPFAASHILDNKEQQKQTEELVQAFSAPYTLRMLEIDSVGMYDTAAEEAGKLFVTTELGGGGTSSAKSVAIAEKGIKNVLVKSGILQGELELSSSVLLDQPDNDCFITSESNGLFEICYDLGDFVQEGDIVARIYDIYRLDISPIEYKAKRSGILTARHFPGLIKVGDTIVVISDILDLN